MFGTAASRAAKASGTNLTSIPDRVYFLSMQLMCQSMCICCRKATTSGLWPEKLLPN
jgi:hypothetical protein